MIGPLAITALLTGLGSVIFQGAKSKALLNIANSTIYSKHLYKSERRMDRERYLELALRVKKLQAIGVNISDIPSFKDFSNKKRKKKKRNKCRWRDRRMGRCK